jgi:non-ribosomal peptide synthetase component F
MVLLAAFAVLLQRWSGQDDLVIGTHVANRSRAELEKVVGFFVNNLALRIDLSGDPTFRRLLVHVREVCLGAYDHQDLPFGTLVQEIRPDRSLTQNPFFEVLLVLQNAPEARIQAEGVKFSVLPLPDSLAKFDLTLFVFERETELTGFFEYDTDLFEAATIARLAEQLRALLAGLVASPGVPVSSLSVLPEGESRELIESFTRQLEEV